MKFNFFKYESNEALNTLAQLFGAGGNTWGEDTAGAAAGATATKAAQSERTYKILWATFYTDADSLLQIKDGSTIVWEGHLDVDVQGTTLHVTFPGGLDGTKGNAVSALIAASSADCRVTFGGVYFDEV